MPGWRANAANVLGFQVVWLACVAGAGAGRVWPGLLAAGVFAAATLRWGGRAGADLRTLLIALPLGLGLDSIYAASGVLVYAQPWPWPSLAPLWIVGLWVGFAMTLNHALKALRQHLGLAAIVGLLGAPLAYWVAASTFSAVSYTLSSGSVMAIVGVSWMLLLPLMMIIDRYLAPSGLHGARP